MTEFAETDPVISLIEAFWSAETLRAKADRKYGRPAGAAGPLRPEHCEALRQKETVF